jgi:hypothetical protein
MLTRATLLRAMRQAAAYGDSGPHYFGRSAVPEDVRRENARRIRAIERELKREQEAQES